MLVKFIIQFREKADKKANVIIAKIKNTNQIIRGNNHFIGMDIGLNLRLTVLYFHLKITVINTERAVFCYGQVFGAGSNSDSYNIELRSCSYHVGSSNKL